MRITSDLLHKFAQNTVNQRKRSEPDLHAAYLTGSILRDDPLLGGTTDIDLVFVHKYQAPVKRETKPLTPEVSLDIYHKIKDDYDQHRQLRKDPWLGYPLTYNHILLFDTDHWLEFIQSSVSAEFHRSDNVLGRVRTMVNTARDNWFSLLQTPSKSHLDWLHRYLEVLALAGNAISGLIGPPLNTRRFLITFSQRVNTLGVPKYLAGFNGLLGFSDDDKEHLTKWIDAFENDLSHLMENSTSPVHLDPCRHAYYLSAIRSLAESNEPDQAIWPLLRTWLDIHLAAPQPSPGIEIWDDCLNILNLTEEAASLKVEALDAYLDSTEILIESWSEKYGF